MRNLHNWSYVAEALRAFRDGEPAERLFALLRKFVDEGETVEAVFPIIAAAAGVAPEFTEIMDVTFKSQTMKAEWANFIYKKGLVDPAGRVLKDFTFVCLQSGQVDSTKKGCLLPPPARQLWLPTTDLSIQHMNHLKKKFKSVNLNWDEVTVKALAGQLQEMSMPVLPIPSVEDAKLTEALHAAFRLGKYFYVVGRTVHLKPDLECRNTPSDGVAFRTDIGTWANVYDCQRQAQNFINDRLQCETGELEAYFRAQKPESPLPFGLKKTGEYVATISDEKPMKLAKGYGIGAEGLKAFGELKFDASGYTLKNAASKNNSFRESETTMNLTQKATAFFGNLKSVGLDLLRVQRGRATLHSAKRVIFAALPIKWGFLARLTGKAKKVENHPLTDLGLALALHGATNFAISDVAKREKYLKYTEEMLVAAGYNVSMKMLPIEDMLDKVFAGVNESEAMTKLKELVKDTGEQANEPQ